MSPASPASTRCTFWPSAPSCRSFIKRLRPAWLREKLVQNLTLTQSFTPRTDVYFSFNAPSWSLSDEAFFYLLFPFLVVALTASRLNRPVRLLLLALGLWLIELAWDWHFRNDRLHHWLTYISPMSRLVDFGIGVAVGVAFAGRQEHAPQSAPSAPGPGYSPPWKC